MSVAVDPLAPVLGQPGYVVVTGGDYELLELVPCRRMTEDSIATCAFLAATVVGVPTEEITE